MAKGSAFEREVCKQLSLWWTVGKSDAVFWRTSNSGGRATVRGKQNRQTVNQCGDITATDLTALPLLHAVTFELKRGYGCNVQDIIDAPKPPKTSYASWIAQAKRSAAQAGSATWAVIHRRDRREAVIIIPEEVFMLLLTVSVCDLRPVPFAIVHDGGDVLTMLRLSAFLEHVRPEAVVHALKKSQNSS